MTSLREFYNAVCVKQKDLNILKARGIIADGQVETSFTKEGLKQDIFLKLKRSVDFIPVTITINPEGIVNEN